MANNNNRMMNYVDRDMRLLKALKIADPGFELSATVRKSLTGKLEKELNDQQKRNEARRRGERTPLSIESREQVNTSPLMEQDDPGMASNSRFDNFER